MSGINKKTIDRVWLGLIILLFVGDFVAFIRHVFHGHNVVLFNPQGHIAKAQHGLMLYTGVVLLVIAIPSLSVLYFIAWKYRESNKKATYAPNMKDGKWLNFSVWAIPTAFMLMLAVVMWPATHRLQPRNAIASNTKPLTIQVISLRWKWLFIYPDQKIATVNFVQIPVNTPVQFELTADEAPMSSFWIPSLGGQLYSMTGHVNRLNLVADTPGTYLGSSAELNGSGFADMKFTTRASDSSEFDLWVQQVKQSPDVLDATTYDGLVKPSQDNTATYYSAYKNDLYDTVITKYTGPDGGHTHH